MSINKRLPKKSISKKKVYINDLTHQITIEELKKSKNNIDYLTYNISTLEQTKEDLDNYLDVGIITMVDSQGLNIIRRNITKIKNTFGYKGINTIIYNYGIDSILKKVNIEMEKKNIDKIVNAKIKIILPQYLEQYKLLKSNNGGDNFDSFDGGSLKINLTKLRQVMFFFTGTALQKKI